MRGIPVDHVDPGSIDRRDGHDTRPGSITGMAPLADLEASQADYRAVLAAVNALGANQREHSEQLRDHGEQLREHGQKLDKLTQGQADTNARVRSIEEGVAEIKDLCSCEHSTAEPNETKPPLPVAGKGGFVVGGTYAASTVAVPIVDGFGIGWLSSLRPSICSAIA